MPSSFGYLISPCQLASWKEPSEAEYFTKYDSKNRLSEIYAKLYKWPTYEPVYILSRTLEYENGELKRMVVPKTDSTEAHHRKRNAWISAEYEYGQFGLTSKRSFGYQGFRNGQLARIETNRIELTYNNSTGKPSEMRVYVYVNREYDDLRLRERYQFEFDEKGNVATAKVESIDPSTATRGEVMGTSFYRYFYDNYPNTVKVRRFLEFSPVHWTVAEVFSTNNLIKYESDGGDFVDSHITYDDFNNAGWTVQWDCK